ncbi:MAG: iron ABC transporter permease [Acidobacteriota bacterium]|nr:iron ABC transporter permease [Blastocatellia bacterium]MDW8411239.1 iron ABC transporter permease [Acidobacteriota bacterium]
MKQSIFLALMLLFLPISVLVGVSLGSTPIPIAVVFKVLVYKFSLGTVNLGQISEADLAIVWLIRVPRVLVAAMVGGALAVAGVQMQSLFQNHLASPDIIGTSTGGALGAVLAISSGLALRSIYYLPLCSFVGAVGAAFLVYAMATSRGRTPVSTLLLSGVALNALLSAVTSFIVSLKWVRWEVAQEVLFWMLGGLENRTWTHVKLCLPALSIGFVVAAFYHRELDLMLLGEETAVAVGVDVEAVRRVILTVAALLTAAAVAVSGVIGFVGLVIPHIVRMVIGPRHNYLLVTSALAGAWFLVLTDLLARTLNRPEEIRIGILTAFFGSPFFIYLLLRRRREISYF